MWFQLKIEGCPTELIEQLGEKLEVFGALSLMLTDKNDHPVLEPEPGTTPLWPEVIIQALFSEALHAQNVRKKLTLAHPKLTVNLEILEDRDWERVWMDDFKPKCFGKRLWICPTWATPPEPEAVNLMLDPGLAFGTGTHPTTSLCLNWLAQKNLNEKTVIDYGCGSGILSLAALKLGAKHLYAIDIDEQALQATQTNALTNNLSMNQLSISAPEALVDLKADLLIANILLAPLLSLKERFSQLMHSGSQLVVSGILQEQTSSLIDAYGLLFQPLHQEHLDGWSLVVFGSPRSK